MDRQRECLCITWTFRPNIRATQWPPHPPLFTVSSSWPKRNFARLSASVVAEINPYYDAVALASVASVATLQYRRVFGHRGRQRLPGIFLDEGSNIYRPGERKGESKAQSKDKVRVLCEVNKGFEEETRLEIWTCKCVRKCVL